VNETALVALFTGLTTAMASLVTAACGIVGERLRAERQYLRELETRVMDQDEAREQALRRAFQDTQVAVLHLGVTVRIALNVRTDKYARLDGEDLPGQLRQVREDYLSALVATETIWGLVDDGAARDAVDQLRAAVIAAFEHSRSAGSRTADPAEIDGELVSCLRAVSGAVFGEPDAPDRVDTG
jgi:hypothetical protein